MIETHVPTESSPDEVHPLIRRMTPGHGVYVESCDGIDDVSVTIDLQTGQTTRKAKVSKTWALEPKELASLRRLASKTRRMTADMDRHQTIACSQLMAISWEGTRVSVWEVHSGYFHRGPACRAFRRFLHVGCERSPCSVCRRK